MKFTSPVLRGAAALGVLAASLAGAAAVSSAAAPTANRPAAPTGDCGWADPAAVADLPVIAALDELSELSTMSAAVAATDLSVQLDGDGPFTIFAPSNDAFAGIPDNVWESIIADPELLSSILGFHVVVGDALTADDLAAAGTVETLSGGLGINVDGDTLVINGGESTVTCAGIQTANATIYVVDRVLQPATNVISGGGCPGSSVPGSSTPDASTPPDVSTAPDVSIAPDASTAPDVSTAPDGSTPPGSSVPC